jgi:hypothetical protein
MFGKTNVGFSNLAFYPFFLETQNKRVAFSQLLRWLSCNYFVIVMPNLTPKALAIDSIIFQKYHSGSSFFLLTPLNDCFIAG